MPVRSAAIRVWQQVLLLTLMVAGLGTTSATAQRAGPLSPPPWPTELGEAFELYYADQFLEVQRLCQELSARTRDPRLRREAAALAAMATMHLPGRADRLSGRARLSQLAEEDPSLLTRPECQLAYGLAQTALNETASALHHLNQAANGFARRGQSDRLAETCVALATAWARHGEWELMVPGMATPRPENRREADRIRRERIRALRERVAALPGGEAYAARIDLVLAEHLLQAEDGAAEALALLEELAHRKEITTTTAEACLALAQHHEAEQRWADAVRLYARVQSAGLGALSHDAEQRRHAIEQPQLILEVPDHVAIGQPVTVKLAVRNLTAVEFEVRRVDLGSWLEQRQGRFSEAALPTSGALVTARSLDTTVTAEHDWWRAETLDEPLAFEAPPGAAVVLARSLDDAGYTVAAKRLVLAGDLRATVFMGIRQAAIWVTHGQALTVDASEVEPQARFWMHGSFVPTRPRFTGTVAVFALPPEARLLRDKRWVCLVQAGEQLALCRGTLPTAAGKPRPEPAVALIGGPPEPHVGAQLHLFGLLLDSSIGQRREEPPAAVQLELLDALGRAHGTTAASVSDAGTFSARLPITAAMAGENLHVAVRLHGQTLERVFLRPTVRVARIDETPVNVRCHLPRWLPPTKAGVIGQIEAAYPWGTALSWASAHGRFRAVRLPTVQPKHEPVYSDAIGRWFHLDGQGKGDFAQPFSDFSLPDGPLAIGLWVEAMGWDARPAPGSAELLVGPEPVHLWVRCETDTPRVGEPLYVSAGWFDPTGLAPGKRPTVEVRRDGTPLTRLRMLPAINGLRSATWRPTVAGAYELVATLPLDSGKPLTTRDTFQVAGRPGADERTPVPLRCEASFTRHGDASGVRVRLDAGQRQRVLALLENGDPLAAQQLTRLDGPADVILPLSSRPQGATRLVLAAPGEDDVHILGVTEVRPADEDALTLSISHNSAEAAPGETVEVIVTSLRAGGPTPHAALMARLVDASRSGGVQWLPGEGRPDLALRPGGIQVFSSTTRSATQDVPGADADVILETRELSAELAQALFDGPTLWVDARSSDNGSATFAVPLPPKPGLYRLVITGQTPDGAFVSDTLGLDTRRVLRLTADVPEHLTVGDRSVATLIVMNDGPAALRARVSFDGGTGLHAEELHLRDSQSQPQPSDEGTPRAFTSPPFGAVALRATIEATEPGSGTAVFTVETEQARQRAIARYTVHAYAAAGAEPHVTSRETVVVHRKLFRLEAEALAEDDTFGERSIRRDRQAEQLRIELAPDERIAPGQLVLVQEEFSLSQPLAQVEWMQRVPGNCHTHAGSWSELPQIGTQRGLRLESLTYGTVSLAAGQRQVREYVVVPVRTGACRFPPPLVRTAGVPVPVEVKPKPGRVIVVDSR